MARLAFHIIRMQIARQRERRSIYWNKETGDVENSQLNAQKAKNSKWKGCNRELWARVSLCVLSPLFFAPAAMQNPRCKQKHFI